MKLGFYRGVSKIRIKTMHGLDSKRAWHRMGEKCFYIIDTSRYLVVPGHGSPKPETDAVSEQLDLPWHL
jgi:hypothetical protein